MALAKIMKAKNKKLNNIVNETNQEDNNYYIAEAKLGCSDSDLYILGQRFNKARLMKNHLIKYAVGRLRSLKKNPTYRRNLYIYGDCKKNIENLEKEILKLDDKISDKLNKILKYQEIKDSKNVEKLQNEVSVLKDELEKAEKSYKTFEDDKKSASKILREMQNKYGLTEFKFHEYIAVSKRNFEKDMDINTAQVLASEVWQSVSDNLFENGKKCHFIKKGNLTSLRGKNNKSGILVRKKKITTVKLSKKDRKNPKKKQKKIKETVEKWCLCWNGLVIPIQYRKDDLYFIESLEKAPQYCRIVRKIVKGKISYSIQLVIKGKPPIKKKKNGVVRNDINNNIAKGEVGIDMGTKTIAISSYARCMLLEFAPKSKMFDRQIYLISRKLDRSRRQSNPQNYNEDGTIKRGVKLNWVRSKNYMKLLYKLKNLYRLKSKYIEEEHNKLANEILKLGDTIYVEKMNYKGLAKKAQFKKGEEKNKNGKNKRKKRFGRSINNKAPAKFLTILERKLSYHGKKLNIVNNYTFKASKYVHDKDEFLDVKLSNRFKTINGNKIQRDLYSAYLLMNANQDLQTTNRDLCVKNFDNFLMLYNIEINRLQNEVENGIKIPSSMGIKNIV